MAPAVPPRESAGTTIRRVVSRAASHLTLRDITSSTPLASVFALIITSRSSIAGRAISALADLPSSHTAAVTLRSLQSTSELDAASTLVKRQTVILCIPTTYQGLNSGPTPGAVVGITLGTVGGFLLLLYIFITSVQFFGGNFNRTVIKEEVIIDKRRSSHSRSKRSSRHSAPPPIIEPSPPRSRSRRRETIVEIEEQIIERRPSRRHSPSRSPSPDLEEVIVEEEETVSDDIVEVIEEHTQSSESHSISIVSPSPPPPRKPSASGRRSGFRIVDPAELGGGDAPMRRMSRRPSGRSP